MGWAAVALIALGGFWMAMPSFDYEWRAPKPGKLMAERVAPKGGLVAKVTAGATKGEYLFQLKRISGDQLVASKTISAPAGYHEHLITLRWDKKGKRAVATIDYDFGDGNLEFYLLP